MSSRVTSGLAESDARKAALVFLDAFDHLDWERFCSAIAPDATVFVPFTYLAKRLDGKEQIELAFQSFFDQVRQQVDGPPYLNLHPVDIKVHLLDRVAVVTFYLMDDWATSRRTIVFQNRDGQWLLVHLHASNITTGE